MKLNLLTIAGFDPVSGAGVSLDIRVFNRLGAYGIGAITAITYQNTKGVFGFFPLPKETVERELEAIASDLRIDGGKVGMVGGEELLCAIVSFLTAHPMPKLVVDPVLHASSGGELLPSSALSLFKSDLLPLAYVVTPNIPEAEALSGVKISDYPSMLKAARRIKDLGPRFVVITGGHFPGEALDLIFDGERSDTITSPKLSSSPHGTGCAFSAALSYFLAKDFSIKEAVFEAKGFVTSLIKSAFPLGKGKPVLDI
ncbi:MAG: bifunctional hydroxymethylpyrimidine kinase/phosphomethylpyrimidine kinase [Acidobacteria bacterium]|nr:bifunctional hydroxymethylpyrimidine kinase/phosphomethylpyrimidine kinase [Acidobacteriota bacterium]